METCGQLAQQVSNNQTYIIIAALTPFIAAVAYWIKSDADNRHRRAQAYRIEDAVLEVKNKVEDVKVEQQEVKKALNGNGGSH